MQPHSTACNIPFLIALIVSSILQAEISIPIIARKSAGTMDHQSLRSIVESLRYETELDSQSIESLYSFGKGALHYAGTLLQEYASPHAAVLFEQSSKKENAPWSLLSLRELLWEYMRHEQWRKILQKLPRRSPLLEYRDFYFLRMSALYRLERYKTLLEEQRAPSRLLIWNRVSATMLEYEEQIWRFVTQYTGDDPLWAETLATLAFHVDDAAIHRRLHIYIQNQNWKHISPSLQVLFDTLAARFFLEQGDFKSAKESFAMLIPRYARFSESILAAIYRTALRSDSLVEIANALADQASSHPDEAALMLTIARLFKENEQYTRARYYYDRALELIPEESKRMAVSAELLWVAVQNNPFRVTEILEANAKSWSSYAAYFDTSLEAVLAELLQRQSWITIGALHRILIAWDTRAAMHIALAYALSPIASPLEREAIFARLATQKASPFAAAIASGTLEKSAPAFKFKQTPIAPVTTPTASSRIVYDYAKLGLRATLQTVLEDRDAHPHSEHLALLLHDAGLSYWVFRTLRQADHARSYEKTLPFYPVLYADVIDYENLWLILAVIREESRFHASIRSSAGAVGLMQLIPATAAELSKNYDIPFNRLDNAQTNIQLGLSYIKELAQRFANPAEIIAAYNAGPSRVRRWKQTLPQDPVLFALAIPFRETRRHVRKVFESFLWYTALYEPESLIDAPRYFFAVDPTIYQ